MTQLFDPKRLAELDAVGVDSVGSVGMGPHDLGAAIRALRGHAASASEVDALARRLAPQLSAPAAMGASGAALGLGVNAKWISGLLCVVAAVGVYAWLQRGATGTESPRRVPVVAPATPAHAPVSPLPESPGVVVEVAQPVEPVVPVAPAARRRVRSSSPRVAAPAPSVAPEAELTLLQRAQATLDRDASGALALAERHARSYPHGLFAQEREVLAIEALLKLRRRPAALARAAEFVNRYPDSPHARRVRALLERSPLAPQPTIAPASDHSTTAAH